jgi:hypothetical protein
VTGVGRFYLGDPEFGDRAGAICDQTDPKDGQPFANGVGDPRAFLNQVRDRVIVGRGPGRPARSPPSRTRRSGNS